jgi:hypothetical protein
MKIINYLITKNCEIIIKIKNRFNRLLIEERLHDLLIELVQIQKPLAYDISSYYKYRIWGENCPYEPESCARARKFLKKYKISIYAEKFDIDKIVECIYKEEGM